MAADIKARRAQGQPTVPSKLADELRCNPFLRPSSPAIREALGIPAAASDVEAFGAIRAAKVGESTGGSGAGGAAGLAAPERE